MQFVYFLATVFALFGVSFGAVTFSSGTAVTIDENIAAGTTVMTAAAGTSATGPVTFTMTQPAANLFAIVAATGVITVATGKTIDAETSTSSILTITGSDAETPANTATSVVTITVTDLNDNSPVFGATVTATLAASAAAGTAVGTYSATDADTSTANNDITYTIPCTTTYSVVSTTGALTVATGVTIPATRCDSIIITAKDSASGADQLSASSTISITIGSDTCTTFTDVCPSGSASLALSLMTMMLGLLTNLMK